MVLVGLAHVGHGVGLGQLVVPLVGQDKELLVRRGVVQYLAALCLKGGADAQGLLVGFFRHREIQAAAAAVLAVQQSQELLTQQAALRQHAAVLLQAVAEIGLQIVVCDDDGLAEQRTALGTAQVKHVAERGVVLQAQIVGGARQAVGHPRAVHEQVESQFVAGGGNVGQFLLVIKGADLGGVRDVDHAGLDLVLVAGVGAVLLHGFADLAGRDLAVFAGQRQALVACGLDGAGLVHMDVPGVGAQHALPRLERRRNDGQIRLGRTDEKVHVGVGSVTQALDLRGGLGAVFIFAIAGGLVEIGLLQKLQNRGGRALAIVTFKTKHIFDSLVKYCTLCRGGQYLPAGLPAAARLAGRCEHRSLQVRANFQSTHAAGVATIITL